MPAPGACGVHEGPPGGAPGGPDLRPDRTARIGRVTVLRRARPRSPAPARDLSAEPASPGSLVRLRADPAARHEDPDAPATAPVAAAGPDRCVGQPTSVTSGFPTSTRYVDSI